MRNYHSLVSSHEKRIFVGSLRNSNLTLILTAGQNMIFSIGTRIAYEKLTEKKVAKFRFQYYSCYRRNNNQELKENRVKFFYYVSYFKLFLLELEQKLTKLFITSVIDQKRQF